MSKHRSRTFFLAFFGEAGHILWTEFRIFTCLIGAGLVAQLITHQYLLAMYSVGLFVCTLSGYFAGWLAAAIEYDDVT